MKDKSTFLTALEQARGVVTDACRAVGVSTTTYYRWKKADPEFMARAEELEDSHFYHVESKLFEAIDRGNMTAIIFYLKTKGKHHGYTEKMLPQPTPAQSPTQALPEPATDSKAIAAKVKNKKAYIVKLLKKQGKYTAELTYQVEITAQLLVRAEMLGDEILADGHKVVNVEYSREGNERVTINPKEKLYLDVLEKGQKALRALGMNTESKERKTDEDATSGFFASLRREDEE